MSNFGFLIRFSVLYVKMKNDRSFVIDFSVLFLFRFICLAFLGFRRPEAKSAGSGGHLTEITSIRPYSPGADDIFHTSFSTSRNFSYRIPFM